MAGIFFLSCVNDLQQVKTVVATDQTPDQVVNDLYMLHSDSGVVQFELRAKRMEQYSVGKKMMIFKDGFEVNFYKKKDVVEAHLEANYGELREDDHVIIARNKVIFTNFTENKTLTTEELFWDQEQKRCRTDKAFEISGPTIYGRGYGLDCNETFSEYTIHKGHVEYKDTAQ